MKKHKNILWDIETNIIQSLSAKKWCKIFLDQVRASRNAHREKTIAAKEELKVVKKKNTAFTQMLRAKKAKSEEVNHRA